MGAHLVLLVGDQDQPFCFCFSLWPDMLNCLHHEEKCQQYKDQPQHPVFPLQLRHLRQNAQSFLRKSSKANLFEENKIPSDPVPIVKLPAAKHGAHACLVVKYIPKLCMYNYRISWWEKVYQANMLSTSCFKSTETRGLLVSRSMILNVLLYALNAVILDKVYLEFSIFQWLFQVGSLESINWPLVI